MRQRYDHSTTYVTTVCLPVCGLLHCSLNEKALRETQTLRAGCSKAEPKIFAPPYTLPGGAGRPKFNQLETVTTFTYKPSLVRIDARNFELSW